MSYTPGPWYVGNGDKRYVFAPANAKPIAKATSVGNARLIAAAPDLLAALRTIAAAPAGMSTDWYESVARAAIAKASAL